MDYEGATEELVQVNAAAGTTLTVDRGVDGTSAATHNAGARVRHVSSARDFSDSRTHENSSNGVHGLSPSEDLVGTDKVQTLNNKTLNLATGTLQNVNLFNTGTFTTVMTGDIATPANNAFTIRPNSAANPTLQFNNDGSFKQINTVPRDTATGVYKIRTTKSDGNTDIFAVLSGGQVVSWMTNGANGFTLNASPDNVKRFAFQVNASDGSTQRSVIYTDGSALFKTTNAAAPTMSVQGAASQAVTFQTTDQFGTPAFKVDSLGNLITGNITRGTDSINYLPVQVGSAFMSGTNVTSVTVAVTFPTPFNSPPFVSTNINSPGPAPIKWCSRATAITATGFNMLIFSGDGSVAGSINVTTGWSATASS